MIYTLRVLNRLVYAKGTEWTGIESRVAHKALHKWAHDLCHNWSSESRTRHIEVKQYFLRELKVAEIIEVFWAPGDEHRSDQFTKNLARPALKKHGSKFFGADEYMTYDFDEESDSESIDLLPLN